MISLFFKSFLRFLVTDESIAQITVYVKSTWYRWGGYVSISNMSIEIHTPSGHRDKPKGRPKNKPEESELVNKEDSQFEQFAEVVVGIREERDKARSEKLELETLPGKEKERLISLAQQVSNPQHPLKLADIHDPQDRQRVKVMTTRPDAIARKNVLDRFIKNPNHSSTPQEYFCQLILEAPLVYQAEKAKDKLPANRKNRSKKQQDQYDKLMNRLVAFNHVLKEIIDRRDGSFTRDQLVGWLSGIGEWPHGKAEAIVAGFVTEVVGKEVCEGMSDVIRTQQPTVEEDRKKVDLKITHKSGRLYRVDFKTGGHQTDGNSATDKWITINGERVRVVEVDIDQKWIKGFKLIEAYRSELERKIRSECDMPETR